MRRTSLAVGLLLTCAVAARAEETPLPGLPKLAEVVRAGTDLWGEAAMRQPNGASYEFFAPLLPPLRYVNADFHYYPLVLSAPRAPVKARLISNGCGINLRGGARSWHDVGTAVTFRVGPDEFPFGSIPERVSEPRLAAGYLPIVQIDYRHPSPVQSEGAVPLDHVPAPREAEVYRLEAFASTQPDLGAHGVVFAKFSLVQGTHGFLSVDVGPLSNVQFSAQTLRDECGIPLVKFDKAWRWDRGRAHVRLTERDSAVLAVVTQSFDAADSSLLLDGAVFEQQRVRCEKDWNDILARGMRVESPEPRVNNAWRNLLVQNFELVQGDRMLYSAGNQYAALYEAEGSDAALALMSWGFEEEMRQLIVPLLEFTRKGLEFHQAGLKLNDVCRLYWQTRDAVALQVLRPQWESELQRILDGRTGPYQLFPKEQYCGDIKTPVHSLSASSKAWRAVRDLAAVLSDAGHADEAARLKDEAAQLRAGILAAIRASVCRDTSPPFVPVALLDREPPHDPITAVRIGSYWNLVINYIMGSGIFPPGSEEELWVPRYVESHGGLCMGMTRSGAAHHTFWTGSERTNPLYGTRYVLDTLRRDDPERALVSLYGMLAHGFTRDTLIGGEGCALEPLDAGGRFFYCPPNSAANAHFLTMLRNVLVQDSDLDDDGIPETLRLLFATPRRWLEDGKQLRVEHAPTAFGPVSLTVHSRLEAGEVQVDLDPPLRNEPRKFLLRVRVPEGWRVIAASSEFGNYPVDERGSVDLTGLTHKTLVHFRVAKSAQVK